MAKAKVVGFAFSLFFSIELVAVPSNVTPSRGAIANPSKIADHSIVHALWDGRVPESAIIQAKKSLKIGYGRTSHGSQLQWGLRRLPEFADSDGLGGKAYLKGILRTTEADPVGGLRILYGSHQDDNPGDWLSGDAGWANAHFAEETREFLTHPEHADYNVIMWSWCRQLSDVSSQDLVRYYLEPMEALERDYPRIIFVYMTGHLDGTGKTGNLHQRNEEIRSFCKARGKWLYDFADIESYDPEGAYYLDRLGDDSSNYDANKDGRLSTDTSDPKRPLKGDRNWAQDWQDTHTRGKDWFFASGDMAHAMDINVNMKTYALWWLFARLGGWDGRLAD